MLKLRLAQENDLAGILRLYTHLNNNSLPVIDRNVKKVWKNILCDNNRHTIIACDDDSVVASATLFINQSLVQGQRPFALVEYVVTHPNYRGQGLAKKLLNKALDIAQENNCYKIMLVTGQSDERVHNLYQKMGYKSQGKTAYVKELEERLY